MHLAKALAASALLLSACGKSEPLTEDKTPVNSGPSPAPSEVDASATPAASALPLATPDASPAMTP